MMKNTIIIAHALFLFIASGQTQIKTSGSEKGNWPDSDGLLNFRKDIYAHDKAIAKVLFEK